MSKRNHIQNAMRNHNIVFLIIFMLTLFGLVALPLMNKDELDRKSVV